MFVCVAPFTMQFKNFASLEGSLTVVRGAILRGLTCVAELLEIDL